MCWCSCVARRSCNTRCNRPRFPPGVAQARFGHTIHGWLAWRQHGRAPGAVEVSRSLSSLLLDGADEAGVAMDWEGYLPVREVLGLNNKTSNAMFRVETRGLCSC